MNDVYQYPKLPNKRLSKYKVTEETIKAAKDEALDAIK